MKKNLKPLPLLLAALTVCAGCAKAPSPGAGDGTKPAETAAVESVPEIALSENGKTDFRLVYDVDVAPELRNLYFTIRDAFRNRLGAELMPYDDYQKELPFEIVVDSARRPLCAALGEELKEGEYAIRAVRREDGGLTVVLACRGELARVAVVERFIGECLEKRGGVIPEDLDIKGEFTMKDAIITSSIAQLRDPCILAENGVYYAYGTGWHCLKNDSGSLAGAIRDAGSQLREAGGELLGALGIESGGTAAGATSANGGSGKQTSWKCCSCSAPLRGRRGQTVRCEYCDTEQTL